MKQGVCSDCNRFRIIHAVGRCDACYHNFRYRTVPEYRRRCIARAWKRDKQVFFGGLYEKVLKRDGYKCVECPRTNPLVVHHKNGKGRNSAHPDNRMRNLVTLCKPCHSRKHTKDSKRARKFLRFSGWSQKDHRLNGCRVCGCSHHRHAAHGLCPSCWQKRKYSTNATYRKSKLDYAHRRYQLMKALSHSV